MGVNQWRAEGPRSWGHTSNVGLNCPPSAKEHMVAVESFMDGEGEIRTSVS